MFAHTHYTILLLSVESDIIARLLSSDLLHHLTILVCNNREMSKNHETKHHESHDSRKYE